MKRTIIFRYTKCAVFLCLLGCLTACGANGVKSRPALLMSVNGKDQEIHFVDELMQDEAFVSSLTKTLDSYSVAYQWDEDNLMVSKSVMDDLDLVANYTQKSGGYEALERIQGSDSED